MTLLNYLFITNGSQESLDALSYGLHLAQSMDAFVTLVGIVEPGNQHHPVQPVLKEYSAALSKASVEHRVQTMHGYAEHVTEQIIQEQPYDLLVIGPLGRPPLRRWLQGRSIRHFQESVSIPILYVPTSIWPPHRILVCLGGLGYARPAEAFALQIAKKTSAEITLLHIVPPLERRYPLTEAIQRDWQHVHQSETVIGENLRQAIGIAQQKNMHPALHIRHGEVIDEILAEIKDSYDLICMGSPYSASGLRPIYTPNISAEIAEHGQRPVYIARSQP